jgi:hypothetical protein
MFGLFVPTPSCGGNASRRSRAIFFVSFFAFFFGLPFLARDWLKLETPKQGLKGLTHPFGWVRKNESEG